MNCTAAFTICSNNYLAQALTLAKSLREHAPDWMFIIGLVDEPAESGSIAIPNGIKVITAKDLNLPGLEVMVNRYNIVELCTALKPSFFLKIFEQYPEVAQVHYLDPDMLVYSDPRVLNIGLEEASIQLVPHHLTPIPLDGLFPGENLSLNHGVFNLGYLGLARGASADKMLSWWQERMSELCLIRLMEGYFVDQLWFNLVPIYFDRVHVLRDPGFNVAFWNLHERTLMKGARVMFEGKETPLIAFHFSGFSPRSPDRVTKVAVRNDAANSPELAAMLGLYSKKLIENGYHEFQGVESIYTIRHRAYLRKSAVEFRRKHPFRWLVREVKGAIPARFKELLR